MTISYAKVLANLTITESFSTEAGLKSSTVKHGGFDVEQVITIGTKAASQTLTMSSGAVTLDLTALTGVNGAAINGTGLKVLAMLIVVPSDNTAAVLVEKGATNGYGLKGTDWSEEIPIGGMMLFYNPNKASVPDIGSGAKTIDFTGTGAETINISVLLG